MKELKIDDKVVCYIEEHVAEFLFDMSKQSAGTTDEFTVDVRPHEKFWQPNPEHKAQRQVVGEIYKVNMAMRFYRAT